MARITKRAVDALQTEQRDAYLWDDDIGGFGVKVTPRGRKVYIYQYRFPAGRKGRTRRYTVGPHGDLTPDEARRRARLAASAVADGRDPFNEEADRRRQAAQEMTIKTLASSWLDAFDTLVRAGDRSERTLHEYRDLTKRMLVSSIGRRRVTALHRRELQQLKAALIDKHGTASANHALRALSAMFTHAVDIGQIDTNPASGLGQFTTKKRERFLSEIELARLGDALRRAEAEGLPPAPQERGNYRNPDETLVPAYPPAIRAIRLLILSGMRRGEVLNLRWPDIDKDRGEIVLERHKSARQTGPKRIPITTEVAEIINTAKSWRSSVFVFPGKKPGSQLVGISKVWDRIRHAAGLADIRLHDLRHSYASLAVSDGMALPLIGSLLGHADTATTDRYAHLHDNPRRKAAQTISARLHGALDRGNIGPLVTPISDRGS